MAGRLYVAGSYRLETFVYINKDIFGPTFFGFSYYSISYAGEKYKFRKN